jgi:signal transduction histidine kinase
LQVLQKEAKRNTFDFTISIHDKLPSYVKGNGDRFKQMIVYFTQTAFKRSSSVKFNVFLIRTEEECSTILLQIQDSGPGMSEHELNVCHTFPYYIIFTHTLSR